MKFTLSLAVLALAASQAMAVIPIPVKECTKTVIVQPTDTGCADFATKNGCTFAELLKWNQKLRTDCLNLDVGAPLCVSVTPGAGGSTPVVPPAVPTGTGVVPHPSTGAATTGVAGAKPTGATSTNVASSPTAAPSAGSIAAKTSAASGTQASMAFAAVGVLASVVYIL